MKTKTVYPAQPAANFNEWRDYVHQFSADCDTPDDPQDNECLFCGEDCEDEFCSKECYRAYQKDSFGNE